MRTLAHFSVVVGFAVLAGCARMGLPPPHDPPVPCTAGPGTICEVKVIVNGCTDIRADPNRAKVPHGHRGDVQWTLVASKAWRFTTNGIVFKIPANPEFDNKRPGDAGFKWNYKHTQSNKEHFYTIEVTDGTQVCKKDPSIMN